MPMVGKETKVAGKQEIQNMRLVQNLNNGMSLTAMVSSQD